MTSSRPPYLYDIGDFSGVHANFPSVPGTNQMRVKKERVKVW